MMFSGFGHNRFYHAAALRRDGIVPISRDEVVFSLQSSEAIL